MKTTHPHTKKASAALLLVLSLSLTGCFQQVPSDKDSTPAAPKASASASASPSASPSIDEELKINDKTVGDKVDPSAAAEENKAYFDEAQKAAAEKPLGFTIADEVAAKATPEAKEAFASFDIEEGTRVGLAFWQSLIQKGDFYKPRDASKDWDLLVDLQPLMTQAYEAEAKRGIEAGGKFIRIPTVDSAGSFGTDRNQAPIEPVVTPTTKFWINSIDANGASLRIEAFAEMTALTKIGGEFVFGYNFSIELVPGPDGSWQVDNTAWKGQQVN